jgi:KDO2-lipid IV(A) lauroyltransferase
LLTPHLGCFEALAKWIAHQTPLTAMYRRPKQEWVARFIESVRNIPNLTMARADTGGVRVALKTLKLNGLLGILPDQVPKQGEGLWLPWFGRDAYTINLPAKLHLATQARMYIIYTIPTADGWQVHCERIVLPKTAINPLLNEAEAISLHLNSALENVVKRHSLYYAWGYKRYKK